jgi:folate-binding protein YgfZ
LETEEEVTRVRNGAGWTGLDRLGLIRVTGPQRVKFLHNLLSNDIATLDRGGARLAALMDLKGHQVAWMRVLAEEDALWCELPKAVRDTVVETFLHYKVGAPVRFEKSEAAVLGLFGPGATEALRALGFSHPPSSVESFAVPDGSLGVLRTSRGRDLPAGGLTLHVDPPDRAAVEERLRLSLGEPMSAAALETLRVEEGIPWHGIDVGGEHLLHETGQLDLYHSPSKGCYLGQEVVARLEGRGGNVNKKLRGLKCGAPAAAGEAVSADGAVVGTLTSAGRSPEFGAIAMGYLHRSHADPGTPVSLPGGPAAVVELPFRT